MSPIDDASYFEAVNPRMEQQQQPVYYEPPPSRTFIQSAPALPPQKMHQFDLFSYIDKTTWIIILVIFIIGFFMGKTTQPVYIKAG